MAVATHPVRSDINLLDGRWYASRPHETYTWMRKEAPVYYDRSSDVWAISRYHDVLAVEKDPKIYSSSRSPRPHGSPLPMMISMDDPDHLRRRLLVNSGFTPRRVREREGEIRVICDEILDRVCEAGECDFVWDIAAPLPLLLIGDMLGFERDGYDDLLRWSDDLMRGTTTTNDAARAKAMQAGIDFREYQLGVIADRRGRAPAADLVSLLCHAEVDGERLDDESLVQETLLILIGGDETTRHVITGGMQAFVDHPAEWAKFRNNVDDSDYVVSAVEEMLRWVTPIKNMARTVMAQVEFHGQTLEVDDQLILLYPSANRDERVFDDPFTFDIERSSNQHLAFGFGTHFCLGASLARLELRVMFEQLAKRLPDLTTVGNEPEPWRNSNFITGAESMPVSFTPTPRVRN